MKCKTEGFTLIELMITVAILAIVVLVAIPSYDDQVRKTRRADAKVALMDAAQQLERCMTNTLQYSGCAIPATSPEGFYTLAGVLTASTYTLTATPTGAQAGDSTDCATMTLNHAGVRSGTGNLGAGCW